MGREVILMARLSYRGESCICSYGVMSLNFDLVVMLLVLLVFLVVWPYSVRNVGVVLLVLTYWSWSHVSVVVQYLVRVAPCFLFSVKLPGRLIKLFARSPCVFENKLCLLRF